MSPVTDDGIIRPPTSIASQPTAEAHLDPSGIALILERPGADDVHKSIHMHIHFGLFADILRDLAATVARVPKDDVMHRDQLLQAVAESHAALTQA